MVFQAAALSITYALKVIEELLLVRFLCSSASDLATMRSQYFLPVALAAHQSAALTLPFTAERLERRQAAGINGTALMDTLGSVVTSMLGGSQSIAGMVSGYSIASMFVTALNCKSHVKFFAGNKLHQLSL
jgi:hypothetical protein